ncbi:MAG: XRE family transcriptional regulator [Bacteroidetes bacterium]|nr:MAG: XRE family transcriptional regulator [Bacteroidota bacterium]
MQEVVNRIEAWMKVKGLSAPELAKELGMNRSTVVHILGGRNKPSLQFIMNLAAFDPELDLRFLLTGVALPTPTPQNSNTSSKPEVKVIEKIKTVTSGKNTMIVLNTDGTYKSFVEQ